MSENIRYFAELPNAPKAVGPYSLATECNGFCYLSGQVGLDPKMGTLVDGGVEAQAKQALSNLSTILAGLGLSFGNVLKTVIFLSDMAHFQLVNGVYSTALGTVKPARSTIQVAGLPLGALVEIEMIAARP